MKKLKYFQCEKIECDSVNRSSRARKLIMGIALCCSLVFIILTVSCGTQNHVIKNNFRIDGNNVILNKKLNTTFFVAGNTYFNCFYCDTCAYPLSKENKIKWAKKIRWATNTNGFIKRHKKELRSAIKKIRRIENVHLSKKTILFIGESPWMEHYEFVFVKQKNNDSNEKGKITFLLTDRQRSEFIAKKHMGNYEYYIYLKGKNPSTSKSLYPSLIHIANSIRKLDTLQIKISYTDLFRRNKFLNPLYQINLFEDAPIKKTRQNLWIKSQFMNTFLSTIPQDKRYTDAISKFEQRRKAGLAPKLASVLKKDHAKIQRTPYATLAKIKELANDNRVIMLNENHWYPKHRIFATQLLKPLKEKGFKYLALEALGDTLLNQRKFPLSSSGIYTREPFFGVFLREAVKLNFKIIGYDSVKGDIEKEQAKNIIKLLDKDPNAKIFVYAGFNHINEKNKGSKRMAEYFYELTGINPVTINQTDLFESDSDNKLIMIPSPSLENLKKSYAKNDYYVINNLRTDFSEIYPESTLQTFFLNISIRTNFDRGALLSVYPIDEFVRYKLNSVPVYNKIYRKFPVDENLKLRLPKGRYAALMRDENNAVIKCFEVLSNTK